MAEPNRLEASFRLVRGMFRLDAAFDVPARGVTALFGPSGSGKTTLMRCLAGLEHAEGFLRLDGECWQDDEQGVFRPAHRRAVGYVFQDARLFSHLSVAENLMFGRRRLPRKRRKPMEPVIELLGLGRLLERRPAHLSGGESQRVAIGRALLADPRLLLMDEPLSGLDQARKDEILPYLETLHETLNIPVCYVSHDIDEVSRLADHIVYLRDGRTAASGPAPEILGRLDLPLAHAGDAISLIDTVVASHDDRFHLTHLDFRGGRFHVARMERGAGNKARVRIHARDVSLVLERPEGTSILNILPVTVEAVAEDGPAQMIVRLDASGTPLLARLTRKSCALLELHPGKRVFAQVKTVALVD